VAVPAKRIENKIIPNDGSSQVHLPHLAVLHDQVAIDSEYLEIGGSLDIDATP
jgi:hypothetical protein